MNTEVAAKALTGIITADVLPATKIKRGEKKNEEVESIFASFFQHQFLSRDHDKLIELHTFFFLRCVARSTILI